MTRRNARKRAGPVALVQAGLRAVPYADVETHLANGWAVLALYPDHALMAPPAAARTCL